MPDHTEYQDEALFNPETHHEHSDVPLRPLWWAIGIFLVFAAVSHVLLLFLFKGFVASERDRAEAPQTEVQRPADASVPKNQPLLQPFPKEGVVPNRNTPVTDLEEMRAAEEKLLHNYGWVDRPAGVARIPIEVAKERAVQMLQGAAPVVPAAGAPGTVVPIAPATSTAAPAGGAK